MQTAQVDTLPHVPPQPSRRALLGGIAGADDPHPAWGAEERRRRAALDGPQPAHPAHASAAEQDAADEAAAAEVDALMDAIATTPARTIPGACEQVRVALYCAETWQGDRNEPVVAALRNALATLEEIGGRAVA